MKQIIFKSKKYSICEIIILFLTFIEFVFVVYCNLCRIPITLDNDAAKVFTHAIEMWNSKTIFIPNWVNETMLELDTALIFAVPIYAVTGDIIISFGISNIIILLLFYFFICAILKRMEQPLSIQLICCALITIPYSFGQLLYFNMMFFSGAFYGIKILLPIMLIWLLTYPHAKHNIGFYIVFSLSTVFSFLFSISSGPYTLLCIIAPITVCYIWLEIDRMDSIKSIFSKWLARLNNAILYVQIIASLAGIIVGMLMHVDSTGSDIGVAEYGDFTDGFLWMIEGFIEISGAAPYDSVNVLTLAGITAISHYAIALLAIVSFVSLFLLGFKRFLFSESHSQDSVKQIGEFQYLYILFAWNLIVIIICPVGINCRYELMNIIPALILSPIIVREFIEKIDGEVRRTVCRFALLVLFIVVAITSDYRIMKNDCRPDMATNNIKYESVIDILHTLPEKQIFLLDDEGRAEVLRALDYKSDKEYLAYMFCDSGVSVHDYYASHTDASFFDDDHLLIVDDYVTDINNLPPYLLSLYEEIADYQGVHIYRAHTNRMDGVAGYEANPHSVDYFYTKGYEIETGSLSGDDGSLNVIGNGEVAVSSPWLINNADSLSVTLNYSADNSASDVASLNNSSIGSITVTNPETGELLADGTINATDSSVALDNIDVSSAYYVLVRITVNDGAQVSLNSLVYDVAE